MGSTRGVKCVLNIRIIGLSNYLGRCMGSSIFFLFKVSGSPRGTNEFLKIVYYWIVQLFGGVDGILFFFLKVIRGARGAEC